jgi:hypothetical protein
MDWAEAGMDFSDALHLAASAGCSSFLTFDQRFARANAAFSNTARISLAVTLVGLCVVLTFGAVYWVGLRDAQVDRANALSGPLIPDNLPSPAAPPGCVVPTGALGVLMGSNVYWTTVVPHVVVQMGGLDMLTLDKTAAGAIILKTLRIFDDRNDIIARIDENGVWYSPDVRAQRPDPSTVVVFDHTDTEVLSIKFLNSQTVQISGIFRKEGLPPIVVTPDLTSISGSTLAQSCFGENKVDLAVSAP